MQVPLICYICNSFKTKNIKKILFLALGLLVSTTMLLDEKMLQRQKKDVTKVLLQQVNYCNRCDLANADGTVY